MSASEEFHIFRLKIGRKDTLPHVDGNLVCCPEAPAVKFIGIGSDGTVIDRLVDIDKLALTATLEDIASELFGPKVCHAEFLSHLTLQSLGNALAEFDMASGGRIPTPRLDVLPRRTLLQIQFTCAVEQMQMNNWM